MQARKSFFIRNKIFSLIFLGFFLLCGNVFAASGKFFSSENEAVQFRIIGSYFHDENKQMKLIVAVHFKIKNGWKIYGYDQFGFGQPPSFDFKNSTNLESVKNNKIYWPKAEIVEEKIGSDTVRYSTYQNEVVIPIELKVQDVRLATNVDVDLMFGLCKDVCIPVNQKLNIEIPSLSTDPDILNLIQIYLPKKSLSEDVLVKDLDLDVAKFPIPPSDNFPNISLIRALIIAFIGGMILNIMPCVLPVLSIKLLSIINHSQAKISRIRAAYMATILGIIFSFLILATITSTLKLLGMSLGWGLQFQNPYFLIFLVIILTFFTSNLLGVFEINFDPFLSNFLGKKINQKQTKHNVVLPNFLSGILAVLLATPCSAPFLGTAISFALSQNISIIFLIFSAMGLGLSSPYFLLLIFPKVGKIFPKPGKWMIKVKQIMAGFLAATIIWLIYVLSNNVGMISSWVIAILTILILAFLQVSSKLKLKTQLKILIFTAIVLLMFIAPSQIQQYSKVREKYYDKLWVKFDQNRIANLVKEGNVVVVDITADWCLTCKVNKILVLNSSEVVSELKGSNVVAMRGDLTTMDDNILNFMRSNNRYAIPFNIVYGPSAPKGILTSEFLNKQKLLSIINQAKGEKPNEKF